jgi:hypothetical protein
MARGSFDLAARVVVLRAELADLMVDAGGPALSVDHLSKRSRDGVAFQVGQEVGMEPVRPEGHRILSRPERPDGPR